MFPGYVVMPCEFWCPQVVPVITNLIQAVSAVRLYIPQDLRPPDNRQSVSKSLQEVEKRFPDGVPHLDPIEDMSIKEKGLKEVVKVTELSPFYW